MKPTRLYIKQHSKTGLRYFGKTGTKLIESYTGSGVYWKNHINKHGLDHVNTIWVSDWFTSEEEIKDFAIAFSELFDIVNSNEWANMKIENGLDGGWDHLKGDNNPMRNKEIVKRHVESRSWYRGSNHSGFGKKKPGHSAYMKSIGWGKNKTDEHKRNHAKSWIESTKDKPIRAKSWNLLFNGEQISVNNLKKFCRDNSIDYLRLYRGNTINGYTLVKNK